jgi:hypothetical protein
MALMGLLAQTLNGSQDDSKETSLFFDTHTCGKKQIIGTHRLQNQEHTMKRGF